MPVFQKGADQYLFIHIPKTGGTSIEAYIEQVTPLALKNSTRPNGFPVTPQHYHAEILLNLFPENHFRSSFTVVRNPLDRMISEYHWRTRNKRPIAEGGTYQRRWYNKTLQLVDFDAWAMEILDLYENNAFINDNHLRPQAEFICHGTEIFNFENTLTPVFDRIDEILETGPGDRALKKKSLGKASPQVARKTKARIEDFYAADYELIENLMP